MDYSKPTLLVVSGPNGAGKSTHIASMLPIEFAKAVPFDRDKTRVGFEKLLATESENKNGKTALSMMEDLLARKMEEAILAKQHFVLETPLSHPDYWKYIDRFTNKGYQVQLNYLCLDKIKDCELRVQQRMSEGGHAVDARTIKGVYEMNLKFINDYKETFNLLNFYDGTKRPELLGTIEDGKITMANQKIVKKDWARLGLPSIYKQIIIFLNQRPS